MLMGFFGEALLGKLETGLDQSVGLTAGLLVKRQRYFDGGRQIEFKAGKISKWIHTSVQFCLVKAFSW